MNTATAKTGGEVDAMCNKCKMVLAHTILAMVGPKIARVRCNTCMSEHAFRGTQPLLTKSPRAVNKKNAAEKPEKVILSFAQQIEGKDPNKAKKYSPQTTFAVGDLIDHPTFGLGIVNAVRLDKVDIAFKAFEKTLVHGKAGGTGPESKPTMQSLRGLSPRPSAPEPEPSAPEAGPSAPAPSGSTQP